MLICDVAESEMTSEAQRVRALADCYHNRTNVGDYGIIKQ